MQTEWKRSQGVCVIDNDNDQPRMAAGMFVPDSQRIRPTKPTASFRPHTVRQREYRRQQLRVTVMGTVAVCTLFVSGFGAAHLLEGTPLVAAPLLGVTSNLPDTASDTVVHQPPAALFAYHAVVPEVAATSYLVADIESGDTLAGERVDTPVAIASLTKLMTALVTVTNIPLAEEVPLKQEKYVQTLIPRIQGSQPASVQSLLELLLIESSNEAAEVLASQLGRERFITRMNATAQAIGMHNTTFTDPSGLDGGNISTAADMVTLLQYLHTNYEYLFDITAGHRTATARGVDAFGLLTNFNIASSVPSFRGGKVGETIAAKQTNASLHQFYIAGNKRTVAVVVLGTDQRTADVATLIQHVEDTYTADAVVPARVGR